MKYNIPLPRVLDAEGNELRRLNLIDASVSLSLVPLSTAQIILPIFESLNMREWVEMYTSQGSVGVFRVRSPGQNYRMETKQYTLDHGIVELSDHVIKTEVEFNTAANSVITQIFSHYDGSMWQLGTVVPTQTVEYSGDHEDILTALMYVMDQLPDYMMQFNQTTKPWTLNIVSRPQAVTGEGRLGRNIVSARVSEDDSRLCTRILSTSLPDGKIDADTISQYGVVERFFGKDEEQSQEEFVSNCNKYLEQHKRPLLSVNLELHDLEQITGEALDNITVGDLYRLALPEYNTTIEQPVISLSWRSVYGDPGNVSVMLAHEEMTMSSAVSAIAGAGAFDGGSSLSRTNQKIVKQEVKLRKESERVERAYDILDEAFIEIEAQGVTIGQQQTTVDLLSGHVKEVDTSLSVMAGQIQSKVSQTEFDSLGERVSDAESSITQTAQKIRAEVSTSQSTVYSYIDQTASGITTKVENTEAGLYSYIEQTASGLHQTISSTTNRTWVQDNDPRSAAGGEYTAKPGDIWIESTHQGTWDGAEGYDWEHDEGYDWSQIMGARIWTFQNGKWELASDKQQVISYTDLVNTADHLISQKIAGIVNDEGLLDVYLSKLEQKGDEIRSEVYSATSEVYSYIDQTASGIVIGIDSHRQKTYVQDSVKDGDPIVIGEDGVPRDADGRPLVDGDIWIDTANQETWDKALNWNWNDDAVYDWNELRDSVIKRYDSKTKAFETVTDGRIYTDQADMDIADDHIKANLRSIDLVQGEIRENAHQFSVTTEEMRSTFNDRIRNMGSEFQQTTDQLRSDYYAANSKIYSEIRQTASALTSKFGDEIADVGTQITQTASEIRSEAWTSESKLYSRIIQTASNIRQYVVDEISDIGTQIEQTASMIRSEAWTAQSEIYSQIEQTASSIRLTVAAIDSDVKTFKGSQLWTTRTKFYALSGKLEVDSNDDLVIHDGGGLKIEVPDGGKVKKVSMGTYVNDQLDAGTMVSKITGDSGTESYAVKMGTYINGKLDAGVMVSKITDDTSTTQYQVKLGTYINGALEAGVMISKINKDTTATIKADKIKLDGYVTATRFAALDGSFTKVISGEQSVSKIVGTTANFSNLEITNELKYGGYGDLKKKIINAFSASASGGEITIASTTLDGTEGPSVNFNIADTQYYKDGVSAAKASGASGVTLTGSWDSDELSTSAKWTVTASNSKTKAVSLRLVRETVAGTDQVSLRDGDNYIAARYLMPSTPSYTPVTYARGGLNSFNNGNSATLYYFVGAPGEESSKYRAAASGSRYWYWSSAGDTLETLYRQS